MSSDWTCRWLCLILVLIFECEPIKWLPTTNWVRVNTVIFHNLNYFLMINTLFHNLNHFLMINILLRCVFWREMKAGKGEENVYFKKSREFSLTWRPPPRGGKVGNLFMIFFRHPRVKFALFYVAICDNWGQENRGIKAFRWNISQEIFRFLRVILTSEITL